MRTGNPTRKGRSIAWSGAILAMMMPLALAAEDSRTARTGKSGSKAPLYLLASQSAQPALDRGKGGGNPFGSALVELLGRPQLDFASLLTEIVELTVRNSRGKQRPDVPTAVISPLEKWQIRPQGEHENRVALVLVFADYSRNESMLSLPGARSDLDRVAAALEGAGFATTRARDPSPLEMKGFLERFATQSAQADVAVLYATGHGVEVDEVVYLLPGSFSLKEDKGKLEERGIRLSVLGDNLKAKKLNLVFYGGCRTIPSDLVMQAVREELEMADNTPAKRASAGEALGLLLLKSVREMDAGLVARVTSVEPNEVNGAATTSPTEPSAP